MKIIVSEISEEGFEIDFKERIELGGTSSEAVPVTAHAEVKKNGADVFIEGHIQASLDLDCVRCLNPAHHVLDLEFSVVYQPSVYLKGDLELHKGDLESAFYSNDEIDLKDLISEQIMIHYPIKPLCDEQCKGLCSKCGANLNDDPCDCDKDIGDSRWKALKNITFERKDQ